MATLNIKNLSDTLYRKLEARARRQGRSVSREVILILEEAMSESEPLSLLGLEGLGRELWEEVNAAEHVERERSSRD